ncbi:MAG: carboxypeptidase regulatory-like domain-containing protein [Bacteroidia bacterium]|nr:carboxypeptidase regulatory-like domain-containing protein [Bacteroidia bacterium]MDW8346465.1 carboxypeptidase regulatory-like domain-containing protein [Bacteroidia bacterium]
MLRVVFISILAYLYLHTAYADGTIRGSISDNNTGELLIGVVVNLEKPDGTTTSYGTTSDIEGNYEIKAPAGTYTVIFTYISYKTRKIPNVKVEEGKTTTLNTVMEASDAITTNVVIVEAEVEKETNTAVLLQQKNMPNISDNISQDMIRRTPDRDGADVLKRLPGISIIDNRFVIVRGLSDRYNNLTLNGIILPSTEPDKKAFSMDIFPAGLISSMNIIKAATADINGEFAGALIQINTKDFPEKFAANISYGVGYNDLATFKPFYYQQGSKTDWLGFDNTNRILPDKTISTTVQSWFIENDSLSSKNSLNEYGKKFKNTWKPQQRTGVLNQSIAITIQDKFNINKKEVGVSFGLNYRMNENFLSHVRQLYEDTTRQFRFAEKEYQTTVAWGGLLNAGIKLNSNHKLVVRTMYNQNANESVNLRTGMDYRTLEEVRMTAQRYLSRNLRAGQIAGEHFFAKNYQGYKAQWRLGTSVSDRQEPDFRRLGYYRPLSDTIWYAQVPSVNLDLGSNASGSRFYSNLIDKMYNGGVDFTAPYKFRLSDSNSTKPRVIDLKVKVGAFFNNKFRDFSARIILMKQSTLMNTFHAPSLGIYSPLVLPEDQIFAPENLTGDKFDRNKFLVTDNTRPSDSYLVVGGLNTGGYVMTDWSLNRIKLNLGLRLERFQQLLQSYKALQSSYDSVVKVNTVVNDFLPSANLTYVLNEKINLRAAYYQTVSRPEFRELAPFAFNDFILNGIVLGNPQLVRTRITNIDARFEVFPTAGELFSVSLFYKKFINPIELYAVFATNPTYTFRNAEAAYNYGIETELRKSLRSVSPTLQHIYLIFNAALIRSRIFLDSTKNKYNVYTYNRPLQGQSPYLLNGGIMYNNPNKEISVSLLYNIFGPRIYLVGSENNPDIYELPRHQLDLQVGKVFKKHYEVRINLRDMLNNYYRFIQDGNRDNKIIEKDDQVFIKTRQGFTSSISVGYRF